MHHPVRIGQAPAIHSLPELATSLRIEPSQAFRIQEQNRLPTSPHRRPRTSREGFGQKGEIVRTPSVACSWAMEESKTEDLISTSLLARAVLCVRSRAVGDVVFTSFVFYRKTLGTIDGGA